MLGKNVMSYQVCDASRKNINIKVPSSKKDGVAYDVFCSFIDGHVSCSCPGFRFRGSCSHTELKEERCGWSELTSPEAQTEYEKANNTCPVCGSKTSNVMSGNI